MPEPSGPEATVAFDGRTVLHVEDNPGDVRLLREALASIQGAPRLVAVCDGLEALLYLQSSARRPDLVLLDLGIPRMSGHGLLRRIKSDPELRSVPVVVLSNSDAPADIAGAYELHANCYLVKPPDYRAFEQMVRRLLEFWLGLAYLPCCGAPPRASRTACPTASM